MATFAYIIITTVKFVAGNAVFVFVLLEAVKTFFCLKNCLFEVIVWRQMCRKNVLHVTGVHY